MKNFKIINHHSELFTSGRFTYLNLYNYRILRKRVKGFDGIYFDGIGLLLIYFFLTLKKVPRYSVDNTSLIPLILKEFENFIVCGGTEKEANSFSKELLCKKNVFYTTSGYFSVDHLAREINKALEDIPVNQKCIVLLGLGSPKQEELALLLHPKSNVTIITVGAFISQYNKNPNYFPSIINKLHLRMPYRLIKENLWSRLPNYFISPFLFVKDKFI